MPPSALTYLVTFVAVQHPQLSSSDVDKSHPVVESDQLLALVLPAAASFLPFGRMRIVNTTAVCRRPSGLRGKPDSQREWLAAFDDGMRSSTVSSALRPVYFTPAPNTMRGPRAAVCQHALLASSVRDPALGTFSFPPPLLDAVALLVPPRSFLLPVMSVSAAPVASVRIFSPSAHLLAPSRSAAEGALAIRQALASALAGSADPQGQEPPAPSFTRSNAGSSSSSSNTVVVRVPAEDVIAQEAAEFRSLAPSATTTRPELDATAKLFLPLPASSSAGGASASSGAADGSGVVGVALAELAKLLGEGVDHVDTLILAWRGVAYEGEELGFFTNKRPDELIGASAAASSADGVDDEALGAMVELWQVCVLLNLQPTRYPSSYLARG
jgi:hypothetical protein